MQLSFVTILFFIIPFCSSAQVRIKIENIVPEKAVLYSLEGEKSTLIDSVSSSDKSDFNFSLTEKHAGFYRLLFNENKHFDFIYDNEVVELETDANNILDSLKIIKSESNKIYYEFVKLNKEYKTKSELLSLIIARYPGKDDYFNSTKDKLIEIQEDYLYFVDVTAQENPNSFIGRYVRSAQLPVIDIEIPVEDQLTYLKTHALDNVNFYDDGLIYSDVFTNKSIEYLTYYRNPQLPLGLLEQEFMKAIDSILSKANVNEIVYKHIVEYLLDGFRKFGFDNVINYIVENYVIKDDICLDESLSTALERRIQQARNFKIGNVVPDIVMQNEVGKEIKLSSSSSDKILLVFYSTDCPHCTELLPELYKLYSEQKSKNFEVLAISLDENRNTWQEYIKTNGYNWINVNDTSGWSSKAARDYYIYATPTMFFVDKVKRLITMPGDVGEIKKVL
jgi:peroxiredoxin